jgi:hypothetical protein
MAVEAILAAGLVYGAARWILRGRGAE